MNEFVNLKFCLGGNVYLILSLVCSFKVASHLKSGLVNVNCSALLMIFYSSLLRLFIVFLFTFVQMTFRTELEHSRCGSGWWKSFMCVFVCLTLVPWLFVSWFFMSEDPLKNEMVHLKEFSFILKYVNK